MKEINHIPSHELLNLFREEGAHFSHGYLDRYFDRPDKINQLLKVLFRKFEHTDTLELAEYHDILSRANNLSGGDIKLNAKEKARGIKRTLSFIRDDPTLLLDENSRYLANNTITKISGFSFIYNDDNGLSIGRTMTSINSMFTQINVKPEDGQEQIIIDWLKNMLTTHAVFQKDKAWDQVGKAIKQNSYITAMALLFLMEVDIFDPIAGLQAHDIQDPHQIIGRIENHYFSEGNNDKNDSQLPPSSSFLI